MVKLEKFTVYTTKEAAEILNKSASLVRYYIETGQLRAQKIGRIYYLTDQTIEEFLNNKKARRKRANK